MRIIQRTLINLFVRERQDAGLNNGTLEMGYGMPYADRKEKYQKNASAEQIETFKNTRPIHANIGAYQ